MRLLCRLHYLQSAVGFIEEMSLLSSSSMLTEARALQLVQHAGLETSICSPTKTDQHVQLLPVGGSELSRANISLL